MPSIKISEEAGVRYLQFNSHWIQGAMRLARPWSLELDYTREMMMALLMRPDRGWPRSVLQIGLGAASITKFLHRNLPRVKLEVVEIDPEVVLNAWQFFRLPEESARLRIELGDGYNCMATSRRRFDLILIDGFDAKGRAGKLHTSPFYRLCRARLNDGGMMVTNLLSRGKRAKANADSIRKAFDGRVLVLPPCDANTVVLAAVGTPIRMTFHKLRISAGKLKADTGLNLLPTVAAVIKACGGSEAFAL
ncbi:MAG: fused MFS/spermidine synthase [Betaproteobacteria bacterium]|nr:fused MFS/spermidine synthase [Betaproteobacteria bacterium]